MTNPNRISTREVLKRLQSSERWDDLWNLRPLLIDDIQELLKLRLVGVVDDQPYNRRGSSESCEQLPEGLRDPLKVMERVRELQNRCRSGLGYQGEFLSETQCTLKEGHSGPHNYASDPRREGAPRGAGSESCEQLRVTYHQPGCESLAGEIGAVCKPCTCGAE